MKKTNLTEIKNLEIAQLLIKFKDGSKELSDLKLKKDLKDIKSGYKLKKDLARILTILNQKRLIKDLKEAK